MILRLVVLLSGHGSTLQALLDAIASKQLHAKICAVISDQPHAFGLQRAHQAHIPCHVISRKLGRTRQAFDDILQQCMSDYQPDLIVLAGFMRLLGPRIVDAFAGKIINIHPALLPKYRGLNTYERVLASKDKYHGSTVHIVTQACDAGPNLAQVRTPIDANDTVDSLEQRVKQLEQQLYPRVLQWFAEQRVRQQGDHIYLDGVLLPKSGKIFAPETLL